MEFFIATQSAPGSIEGKAIRLFTEARCTPPWVLGPAHPCTHAFVLWTHQETDQLYGYRLDGESPHARMDDLHPPVHPTAYWRLDGNRVDLRAARARALDLDGAVYDGLELVLQALPGLEMVDVVKRAMICTGVVRAVLFAAGGPARELASGLKSLFPEYLARALAQRAGGDVGSGAWLSRIEYPGAR